MYMIRGSNPKIFPPHCLGNSSSKAAAAGLRFMLRIWILNYLDRKRDCFTDKILYFKKSIRISDLTVTSSGELSFILGGLFSV